MTTVIKSVEINATRDTIRKYYAHPIHSPQWATTLTLFEPDEAWPNAGSTAKMRFRAILGDAVEGVATTVDYDDDTLSHHWHLIPDNGDPSSDFWITFDEEDGKTTATTKFDYTIPDNWLGKALDKLYIERQIAKNFEQVLLNLKSLAEADPD